MRKKICCKICGALTTSWFNKLFDDRHGYPGYFSVRRCRNCQFGQLDPQISEKQIGEVYEKYYPRQNIDLRSIKISDYKPQKISDLRRKGLLTNCHYLVPRGSRVLDVGSGVGYSLLELKMKKCRAYGIDPDSNATKFARKFRLNFHQGFIEDHPFNGMKFDYVVASQVLEHTNNPKKFILECLKRLDNGGKLILSFPNSQALTLSLFKRSWLHWHIPYHLNFFTRKSLESLFASTGVKVEKIWTETPNLWTNLQLRRLLIKPQLGSRDTFWDNGSTETESQTSKTKSFALYCLRKIFGYLENYNYINRLIDKLNLGDSFVVILVPKKSPLVGRQKR